MADTVKLSIDGIEVQARPGQNILEAARGAGIYIPYLCWHPILKSFGACRMCVVEVEKQRGLPASCTTLVAEGMVVRTNTDPVKGTRKEILDLLLSEHPHGCLTCHRIKHCGIQDICLRNVSVTDRCVLCPQNERCELQNVTYYVNMQPGITLPYHYRNVPLETRNPFIDHDMNLCIMCARCVRTCHETEGVDAITIVQRGDNALIGTSLGGTLEHSGCTYCGSCVDVCPVGAIVEKDSKWAGAAEQVTTTVCSYCSVGCRIDLQVSRGKVIRASADFESPASKGQTCAKGKFGDRFIHAKERLSKPLVRKDGQLVESTWDEALDFVASRLANYKGDQFGALSLGKATNEEHYLLQKFTRAVMGTNNVDHVDSLCPPETLQPLLEAYGALAASSSVEALSRANCFLVVDADVTSEHPVLGAKLRQAVLGGATLLTVDPRETEMALLASRWLRPRPGSEPLLLQAMAKVILEENLADQQSLQGNLQGLDDYKKALSSVDLKDVEERTGVSQEQIRAVARTYAAAKPAAILFTTALQNGNGQAPSTNSEPALSLPKGQALTRALLNLALLTGNADKPSGGVHPLQAENNSQGASDVGVLPSFLPGYQPVTDPAARAVLAQAWHVAEMPDTPGKTAQQMLEVAQRGELKALLVSTGGTHLAGLDLEGADEALKRLDLLVVMDLFPSDLARKAHAVLPLASFAEEDATFTNLERRVQRVRKAVASPGEARPGWWAVSAIAQRMGSQAFGYESPSKIMDEIARVTPAYTGLSHQRLEEGPGLQWPVPASNHPGTAALPFAREVSLTAVAPGVLSRPRSNHAVVYNYLLREIDGIRTLQGKAVAELSTQDARSQGIVEGEQIEVSTPFGSVTAVAKLSASVPSGCIYVAHPWGSTLDHLLHQVAPPASIRLSHIKVCFATVRALASKPV